MDLRERIVRALVEGASVSAVALRFEVSHDTVERYKKRHERGEDLAPRRPPGRRPSVPVEEHAALRALVQSHPDATIEGMSALWQEQSGQALPRSTMHDHLRRVGARFKKTRVAKERCEEQRQAFRAQIEEVPVEKLVFLDECGFALNLHRLYGWALGGARCEEEVPLGKGVNLSVVGAFSLPTPDNDTGLTTPGCGRCGTKQARGRDSCSSCSCKKSYFRVCHKAACLCWTTPVSITGPHFKWPSKRQDTRFCFCRLTRPTSTPSNFCGVGSNTSCEHLPRETTRKDKRTFATCYNSFRHNTPRLGLESVDLRHPSRISYNSVPLLMCGQRRTARS